MKKSNKYSGKKLRRPDIDKPFVKITSKLITCSELSDPEFRLLCLLFSYSNGTTITVKNIAEKLHKKERTVLDILPSLVKKGVMNFTDTHLELFNFSKSPNCENPQCENPQETKCDISQPSSQESSHQTAENRSPDCEEPQSGIIDNTDNQNIAEPYNIINNKTIINKNISDKTSIPSGDNSLFSNSENDDLIEIITSTDNSEDTHPIEGVDFVPKEELERTTSKEGKPTWKLKNKPVSKFLYENNIPKFIEIYNQWINLDIIEHSKFSFAVFEIVAVYMIVTCNPKLIFDTTSEYLNRYVKIYSLDDIPRNLNGFLEEFIEELKEEKNTILKTIQPYRLPVSH